MPKIVVIAAWIIVIGFVLAIVLALVGASVGKTTTAQAQ